MTRRARERAWFQVLLACVDVRVHLVGLDTPHVEPAHHAVVEAPAPFAELQDERQDRGLVDAGLPRGGAYRAAVGEHGDYGDALLHGENVHGLAFPGRLLHARRSEGVAWGNPPMFGPAPDYQSGVGLFNDKLTIRLGNKCF